MAEIELVDIGSLPLFAVVQLNAKIPAFDGTNTQVLTVQQLRDFLLQDTQLSGNPTASTPTAGDNTSRLATMQALQTALAGVGLNPATQSGFGTVKTNSTDAAPIVYLRSETDALIAATRPVDRGGTGATTAPNARANLGAAASGTNNDITSLAALTSTPSVIQSAISAAVPPGVWFPYGGLTAPPGYLLCNGAAVSRTTYAALFAAISTRFGVGDGSTTFNLPPQTGRGLIGAGVSPISGVNRIVGALAGIESKSLSISEMPTHNHGGVVAATDINHYHSGQTNGDGNHSHVIDLGYNTNTLGGGSFGKFLPGSGYGVGTNVAGGHVHYFDTGTMSFNNVHTHGITLEGGANAFSVLNPVIATNFIIKF